MAQPLPKPDSRQPLLDVLALNNMTIKEMSAMLTDGAQEVDRLIPKLLEQNSTGSTLKAAQLAVVKRELRVVLSALWGDLGRSTRTGVEAAVIKAAEGAEDVLFAYLAKHGVALPEFRAAMVQQAKNGIAAVLAKAKNNIPLSSAVYKTQQWSTGLVHRKVSQGLLLGHNAKTIAKSVKDMINPNVAGGVSYAAFRLARTEINHAYKTSQEQRYADEPWTNGMRWNLSKSHPAPDICNKLATQDAHHLGAGVYKVGQRPDSHPNCLCYLTAEQEDEDSFLDNFVAGKYNDYIDEKIYTHVPGGLPCS